jgi:hypothetical protein
VLKIGLISNPNSQRNRRGLDDLRGASAGVPDLVHIQTDGRRSPVEILAELARQEIGLLVVNGGDGTVQRVLTGLFEARPFETPPPVAILPRGMANTIASDVGLRGRPARALSRLIGCVRAGEIGRHLAKRHVLRVENIRDLPPQRCMLFGAAAIYDAIEFCCSRVYALGFKGNLGMGLTLGGMLLSGLLGAGNGLNRGHDIAVAIDDEPMVRRQRLLVLATTLDRLNLRSRPFWAEGDGSIRFTSIAHPPARLIRSILKVLYGWRRATLPPDTYLSQDAERIVLRLDSPFTMDGELFEPSTEQPLLMTARDSISFVRL